MRTILNGILAALVLFATVNGRPAFAANQKPTEVVEDFFTFLQTKDYAAAAELLSSDDRKNFESLKAKAAAAGKPMMELSDVLANSFFLMQGQENSKMTKKAQDGETILPKRVGFFVPGQHYIVGNFAVVFTRETYELAHADTGPVRDDPRKLWIDPTNILSQVRDEAYFKQWWVWEEDRLTMPGLLWMVKERNKWRIDMYSGTVPRKAFDKILRWHFGRDVFEEQKPKPKAAAGGTPKKK